MDLAADPRVGGGGADHGVLRRVGGRPPRSPARPARRGGEPGPRGGGRHAPDQHRPAGAARPVRQHRGLRPAGADGHHAPLRAAGHGPRSLLRDGGDPARLHRVAAHPGRGQRERGGAGTAADRHLDQPAGRHDRSQPGHRRAAAWPSGGIPPDRAAAGGLRARRPGVQPADHRFPDRSGHRHHGRVPAAAPSLCAGAERLLHRLADLDVRVLGRDHHQPLGGRRDRICHQRDRAPMAAAPAAARSTGGTRWSSSGSWPSSSPA